MVLHRLLKKAAPRAVLALLITSSAAQGATDTWKATASDNNFSNSANWTTTAPGSGDTALFNSSSNFTSLTIGSTSQALNSLTFDTSAAAFIIGSTAGNGIALSNGGTIQIASTFSGTNLTETINAPLTGFGASNSNNTYTFANNSSAANNDLLVIGGSITSSNNGGHTTAITFTGTGNGSVSGIISGSGGGLSVTKSGSGTWILTGSNTYTGGTTVSAGTLLVDDTSGSGTGTGSVTVSGTGTLGGTGTISGPVTIQSGGTLNPGNSGAAGSAAAVGTLHTGALTLQSGSNSVFDVATPTNFDKVISSGALNLGGNLNVNIASGQTFTQGQTLTLFSGTSETGTFTGLANNQVVYYDGYGFTADYTNTGFSLVAIPEPSTWFAAALTLLALGYTQRRKLVPALKLFRR